MTERAEERRRTNELKMFRALKRIANAQTPDWLRKNAEKAYGLEPDEALEMAYENLIFEAKEAVRGVRLPLLAAEGRKA